MSWTRPDGAAIESPRRPRCPELDALADWVRDSPKARCRAYRTWLLKLGGLNADEIAKVECVDPRTVRNRVAAVENAIASFREPRG